MGPERVGADVARVVGHDEQHHGHEEHGRHGGDDRGIPPAGTGGERRDARQEDELAGGVGGAEDAGDQAATALGEPAVRDDGAEDERHRTGADADGESPQQPQLPGLGHDQRQAAAQRDEEQGGADDPADAEALHEGGGEGRGEPVDDEVGAHGPRGGGARPAELALQRLEQRAGRGAEAGGSHQRAEHHQGHPPGAVDAGSARGGRGHRRNITRNPGGTTQLSGQ